MAPTRAIVRMTDDGGVVAAGLRELLATERAHVADLEAIEERLARPLRFTASSGHDDDVHHEHPEEWLRHPALQGFFATTRLLAHYHRLYADRLSNVLDDSSPDSPSTRHDALAAVLIDRLMVTRPLYAELQGHQGTAAKILDAAVRSGAKGPSASSNHAARSRIVREFLVLRRYDTAAKLVAAPGQYFLEALERTEIVLDSAALARVCEETRAFLAEAKATQAREQAMIDLQSRLIDSGDRENGEEDEYGGDGVRLSGRTVLGEGPVVVQETTINADDGRVTLILGATAAPTSSVYCHCFDDGTFLLSHVVEAADGRGTLYHIRHRWNLLDDAIFAEPVPESILAASTTMASTATGAMTIITETVVIVLLQPEPTRSRQQFKSPLATATGLLEQNDRRLRLLRDGRCAADLELPRNAIDLRPSQTGAMTPPVFPAFHDDPLPGVFWVRRPDAAWALVELVRFDRWLLVFELGGWSRHRLYQQLDTSSPSSEILEMPPTDTADWGLVLQDGGPAQIELELRTSRRTRVDFWYDQISKALDAAAAERRRHHGANGTQTTTSTIGGAPSTSPAGRVLGSADNEEVASMTKNKKSSRGAKTTTTRKRKLVKSTDTDTPAQSTPEPLGVVEATPPAEVEAASPQASAEAAVAPSAKKRVRTPPVKTPKQRWVRRKTEDPEDDGLEPTQPQGPGEPTPEPTPSKAKKVATRPSSTPSPAPASAGSGNSNGDNTTKTIRIIFTGIEPTAKTFKKISAIPSATYEEDIEKATHVIAPRNQLKRTVKLLCGISCCEHIVDERWLDESARAGMAVYERQHCLADAKAEAKWGFVLRQTMYDHPRATRRRLFAGHRVFITRHKSVLPPAEDLARIVECAGGTVTTSGTAEPTDLVITSPEALGLAAVRRTLAAVAPERICSTELVLRGILQQRLDLESHRLPMPGDATSSRRNSTSSGRKR